MFITREAILLEKFFQESPAPECGASVHFVGRVRNRHEGKQVTKLHYDCYEGKANRDISTIIEKAKQRFPGAKLRVLHRVGLLQIGDIALALLVHAPHRQEAFQACQLVLEQIKQKVPIWKKEYFLDGAKEWVEGFQNPGN